MNIKLLATAGLVSAISIAQASTALPLSGANFFSQPSGHAFIIKVIPSTGPAMSTVLHCGEHTSKQFGQFNLKSTIEITETKSCNDDTPSTTSQVARITFPGTNTNGKYNYTLTGGNMSNQPQQWHCPIKTGIQIIAEGPNGPHFNASNSLTPIPVGSQCGDNIA